MTGVEIRRIGPGDAALFDRIAEEVFDEPVRADRLAAYLAEPGHHMFLAIRDGEVVGQLAAVVHKHPDKADELYIDEVGVTPSLWRRGIGRKMMEEALALGRSLGCGEAWLGTETGNVEALGLYRALGAPGETMVYFEFDLKG